MNNGWIKLHRQLEDKSWANRPLVLSLFVHLLLMANHEVNKFFWNGAEIEISSGQLITGLHQLSKRTGISTQSVRTALGMLKSTSTITIKSTNKYSLITILKWGEYQSQSTSKLTSKLTNNQQTTNKQLTTNKNDKNEKTHTMAPTSKNSHIACTEEELNEIALQANVSIEDIRNVHDALMDTIRANEYKHKTVYYGLKNWVRFRIAQGSIKQNTAALPDGYKLHKTI